MHVRVQLCTTKGIFECSRIPCVIGSVRLILNKVMEQMLNNIQGVAVFLDGIQITRERKIQHFEL